MAKKNIAQEFIEFISRGNVVDLAVGVIIGGAFTSVVNALVTNLIQPLISAIGGNPEVKGMALVLNGQTIDFGDLKNLAAEKAGLAKKAEEEAAPEPRTCPYCKQEIADDATRCPHCTAKLEGYENPAE